MQLADALEDRSVSYEEYLGWPETTAPIEFVDGHPIVSPSPTTAHAMAAPVSRGCSRAPSRPAWK